MPMLMPMLVPPMLVPMPEPVKSSVANPDCRKRHMLYGGEYVISKKRCHTALNSSAPGIVELPSGQILSAIGVDIHNLNNLGD